MGKDDSGTSLEEMFNWFMNISDNLGLKTATVTIIFLLANCGYNGAYWWTFVSSSGRNDFHETWRFYIWSSRKRMKYLKKRPFCGKEPAK